MDIETLLHAMPERHASDMFLSAGAPPTVRVQGESFQLVLPALSAAEIHTMANSLMSAQQQREFESTREMNLGYAVSEVGRFRINVYQQRGTLAIAVRFVPRAIPTVQELNLPAKLLDLIMVPRGLVLVVGATGSGKTTTLASMIDHRNRTRSGHILTIEEPIEFLHTHRKSIVDQREIGVDTLSYASALKNAMRQSPDVILIGEIRDLDTMRHALAYAETGHLCLATLHASNANQAVNRILNFFPEGERNQVLVDLSMNLRAVISQRLLSAKDGGRIPAVELLLHTAHIADVIEKGALGKLKEAMVQGAGVGMQTFDDSLYHLFNAGMISIDEALGNADSRTDLALRIRLNQGGGMGALSSLQMQSDPPATLS